MAEAMKEFLLKCEECSNLFTSSTAETLYECSNCETKTLERRCESCNKFTAKLTEDGCPACNEGEGQVVCELEGERHMISLDDLSSLKLLEGSVYF